MFGIKKKKRIKHIIRAGVRESECPTRQTQLSPQISPASRIGFGHPVIRMLVGMVVIPRNLCNTMVVLGVVSISAGTRRCRTNWGAEPLEMSYLLHMLNILMLEDFISEVSVTVVYNHTPKT